MIDVIDKPFVSAVIVCAGSSTRMGGVDKMFIPIGGKNAIVWSAEAFDRSEYIDEIVIVAKAENIESIRKLMTAHHIRKFSCVTAGGNTRQQSVANGVAKCWAKSEYVAVHDGARPLVTTELIDRVLQDAFTYGAAVASVKVKDTIKSSDGGLIKTTLNRAVLYGCQTPQIFRKDYYQRGAKKAMEAKEEYTDDCQLLEHVGIRIFLSEGSYENIKITTPEDIAIADALLKRRAKSI